MKKSKLTLHMLENMKPGRIINSGEIIDDGVDFSYWNSNQLMKRVAVRGNIADRAIYVGPVENSIDRVMRIGDKVGNTGNIRACIDCDDEVLKKYRY